jgi:catechol 2,3-dioxygenase-like lactoylglutathione lyase family enzyme
MKRLHIHVSVEDLAQSVRFYSALFAARPTVAKPDYAKWMLDDPRVNFAVSARGGAPGVQHLGIQAETPAELEEVFGRLSAAGRPVPEEAGVTCCYARSEKQWVSDPQGVPWETFLTHGESTVYGDGGALGRLAAVGEAAPAASACCAPKAAEPAPAAVACCGSEEAPA